MDADPTMDLIRSLDDPDKWVANRGVVVFRGHERDFPETKLTDGTTIPASKIKVADTDLAEIAKNINRVIEESGQLVCLTVGHRKFDPGFDESKQPKLTGFARNYRAEKVTRDGETFLGLVHDEYVPRDQQAVYRQYPYRSSEYDPSTKTVSGVALLLRPPALKLGTVYAYSASRFTYAMEAVMADDKDDDKPSPDEEKAYQKMCRYMSKRYPKLAAYMDEDPKPIEKNSGSDEIRGKNQEGQKRAMWHKDPNPDITTSQDPSAAATATYAATLAELRQRLDAETAARISAECRQMLDPLKDLIKFDYERELGAIKIAATSELRAAHVKYMAENYMPLPGPGGMIQVYQGDVRQVQKPDDPHKDYPNRQKVQDYIRSHPGCSYEEAVEKAAK